MMKEPDKNDELIGVPLQELWTIQQVSHFLHIPVGTLYQWRHRGYGPPAWRLGRSLRYDAAAVRRWLVEEPA
jgi:predicted DNA-binding transcriptional regulator AlpA